MRKIFQYVANKPANRNVSDSILAFIPQTVIHMITHTKAVICLSAFLSVCFPLFLSSLMNSKEKFNLHFTRNKILNFHFYWSFSTVLIKFRWLPCLKIKKSYVFHLFLVTLISEVFSLARYIEEKRYTSTTTA